MLLAHRLSFINMDIKMKLKNAGIAKGDIKTALKRVIDGEIFYYESNKIYFDFEHFHCSVNPFRINNSSALRIFDFCDEFCVEDNDDKEKQMKKYKNAGIKSKKEAIQRLISGERFWFDEDEIYFDTNDIYPLRIGQCFLAGELNLFEKCKVEQIGIDWRENIGKGVLCWVWDRNKEEKIIRVITGFIEKRGSQQYITRNNFCFNYAEPMTEAEVMEYVLK